MNTEDKIFKEMAITVKHLYAKGFRHFKTKVRKKKIVFILGRNVYENDIKLTIEWFRDDPGYVNWYTDGGYSGNDPVECISESLIDYVVDVDEEFDYAFA